MAHWNISKIVDEFLYGFGFLKFGLWFLLTRGHAFLWGLLDGLIEIFLR